MHKMHCSQVTSVHVVLISFMKEDLWNIQSFQKIASHAVVLGLLLVFRVVVPVKTRKVMSVPHVREKVMLIVRTAMAPARLTINK